MTANDQVQKNEWEKLKFHDPQVILERYREIEPIVAASDLPDSVKSLRTNKLKGYREGRDAAFFGLGMSVRLGTKVFFAPSESADYDFVTLWRRGDERVFTAVQLKEVPPEDLNPQATVNEILAKLAAPRFYPDQRTAAAIIVKKAGVLHFSDLEIPDTKFGSLWLYGASRPDQSEWFLYGDLLHEPQASAYAAPA